MTVSYLIPSFLADYGVASETYTRWLNRKTQSLLRRDRKRGLKNISAALYRREIHEAVVRHGGIDAYTGEQLRWDLISKYDNDASKERGFEVIKEFAMLPTVDHVAQEDSSYLFEICAWRTNDAKTHMTYSQLVEFASRVICSTIPCATRKMMLGDRLPEASLSFLQDVLKADSFEADHGLLGKVLHIGTCRPEIFRMFPTMEFECLDAFGDLWASQQLTYEDGYKRKISDRFKGLTNALAIETEGLGNHIARSVFLAIDLPISRGLERLYGSDPSIEEFIAKKVLAYRRPVLFFTDITDRTLDFYYDWLKSSFTLDKLQNTVYLARALFLADTR